LAKNHFFPRFFLLLCRPYSPPLFLHLRRHHHHQSSCTIFPATLGMSPTFLLSCPGKPTSSFSPPNTSPRPLHIVTMVLFFWPLGRLDPCRPNPRKKGAQTCLVANRPNPVMLGPDGWAGPTRIFYNNIIIIVYYNIFYYIKNIKKSKNKKNPSKIFVIFLHVFLPISLNIELYFYIVRYKPHIKIPDFLRNISKNKFKTLN